MPAALGTDGPVLLRSVTLCFALLKKENLVHFDGVGMHVSSDFEPTTLSVGSIAPKTAAQVERSASTGATLAEFVFY